ncbi:MAG: SAV_2336 N-terminal domain-related protein, partial [Brasilonema sp.]
MSIVSDCISPAWRKKFIHPLLELWGRKGLMTILQLLPERLWERTALASEIPVQLHSLNPGVFNSQLIVETWDDDTTDEIENAFQEDGNKIQNPIPVPIITLEREPLLKWSRVIAGLGNVRTAGFKFSGASVGYMKSAQADFVCVAPDFQSEGDLLTPQALVSRFRATASPLARRLAGLMAAAPVSLPVVQLIQQTLLPQSSQIHVAEVFMSGLLIPLTPICQDTEPDYIEYEFVKGVRELLLESVPVSKTISVIDNVSEFVAQRLGLSVQEFEARLLVPASQEKDSLEANIRPFAQLKAQVLRQLGGDYARFAQELEPQTIEEKTTDTIRKLWNNRHLLWQQNNTKVYSLWTFSPWSLPFDALVISVSNNISNRDFFGGGIAQGFIHFLGVNSVLFLKSVYDAWEQNHRSIISPDSPLLIPLPYEINNQLSFSDEYQANRFVILATVQSPRPSVNNTTQAVEAVIRLAAEQRLTRVVLPLLGTGGHNLPVSQVATAIIPTINKVLKALPSNPIEEITLISQEKSKITTIEEVVQSLYGQNKESVESHHLLDFDFEVVTVNHRGKIIKRETKQARYFTEDLGNSITIEMIAIPGGKFMMGSSEGERYESEKPQHEVTIQPFFMGKYPVTQAQWRA